MMNVKSAVVLLGLVVCGGGAFAQEFAGTIETPSIDRWVYPFAGNGRETSVPIFAALRQPGFDDRDSNMLLAFDTSAFAPPGLPAERYAINQLTLAVYIQGDNRFVYDGTFDSVNTSFATTDPLYVPDSDEGKPIELFAVGYRNGFSDATFVENSPFTQGPVPAEGVANVFPADFDGNGLPTIDIARQVRQRFEAVPLAVGTTDEVAVGAPVPGGTRFEFTVNITSAAVREYVQRGLSSGQLRFMVSSLHATSGGPGGGTGGQTYPAMYTKESAVAQSLGFISDLSLDGTVFPGADFNLDGGVDGADVEAFFTAWSMGATFADFNLDGGVDGADVEAFFRAWELG
jgi:hypothetical protein